VSPLCNACGTPGMGGRYRPACPRRGHASVIVAVITATVTARCMTPPDASLALMVVSRPTRGRRPPALESGAGRQRAPCVGARRAWSAHPRQPDCAPVHRTALVAGNPNRSRYTTSTSLAGCDALRTMRGAFVHQRVRSRSKSRHGNLTALDAKFARTLPRWSASTCGSGCAYVPRSGRSPCRLLTQPTPRLTKALRIGE